MSAETRTTRITFQSPRDATSRRLYDSIKDLIFFANPILSEYYQYGISVGKGAEQIIWEMETRWPHLEPRQNILLRTDLTEFNEKRQHLSLVKSILRYSFGNGATFDEKCELMQEIGSALGVAVEQISPVFKKVAFADKKLCAAFRRLIFSRDENAPIKYNDSSSVLIEETFIDNVLLDIASLDGKVGDVVEEGNDGSFVTGNQGNRLSLEERQSELIRFFDNLHLG